MADYASNLLAAASKGNQPVVSEADRLAASVSGATPQPPTVDYGQRLAAQAGVDLSAVPTAAAPKIDRDQLTTAVIAAQKGPGASRSLEEDLLNLNDTELNKIYGNGTSVLRDQMYAELRSQKETVAAARTGEQFVGDSLNKAAQGAIGFIGGGLALSAGAGNYVGGKINDLVGIEDNATTRLADQVAPAISGATQAAVGWLDSFTSDVSKENQRLVSLENQVDSQINAAEHDAAIAAGGNETFESLKQYGKDFLDAGANIITNPMATSDFIAGALGSLGPSAKVVGGVTRMVESTGTYKAAQLAAAIDNTAMGKILGMAADATKAGATAGAVGLTEAAGTYQQTLQGVLDTPDGDLMRSSAEFKDLVKSGVPVAEAKIAVAERTAREAFFTQLPIATATSILALKFDANPLKAMGDAGMQEGLAGIGREILGQTVEEAIQSGSGQYAQNVAVRDNVNPAQELVTGVGEQAAMGAIGGAGMAGVLGAAPALGAAGTAISDGLTGSTPPSAGPTPFGPNDPNSPSSLDPNLAAALQDKAQSDIAKMEAQVGPLTELQANMLRVLRSNQGNPENLYKLYVPNERSPAAQKAAEDAARNVTPSPLSEALGSVKDKAATAAGAAKDLFSKVSAGAQEGFAKAKDAVVEKANEINSKQSPEAAAETVQASSNSVVAVYDWNNQTGQDAPEGIKQATAPKAEDVPEELRSTLESAPDLVSTVSSLVQNVTTGAIKIKDLSTDGLLYANEHFDKLRAALPTMPKDVRDNVQKMLDSPAVAKIQARVKGIDLSSKVGASISAIKRMVRIDPTKINSVEVAQILEQRDRTDLTDEDVRLLTAASKISSAVNNHAGNQVEIDKGGLVDFSKPVNAPILGNQNARVSRSIQQDGFQGLRSITDYASDIFRAAQSPDGKAVGLDQKLYSGPVLAAEFANFTQHMINKVEALNKSHDAGGTNVQYESLNAKSRKMVPAGQAGNAKSVVHYPGNPGSTKNAQAIYNDMKATVEVYNTLAETFPAMFPDGPKTLPVLKITPPKAEAEPKPAQTEAKPKSEATAKGEADQTKDINIWFGSGENADLSNLASRSFTFEGHKYLSVEHAYQSLKSGQFDPVAYGKYTRADQKIAGQLGTKTENNFNIKLMGKLIDESFAQNPAAAEKLAATGDAQLTHNQDRGIWKTEFPRLLMETRAKIQDNTLNSAEVTQLAPGEQRPATAEEQAYVIARIEELFPQFKIPRLKILVKNYPKSELTNGRKKGGHHVDGKITFHPEVMTRIQSNPTERVLHIVRHEFGHWVDDAGIAEISGGAAWAKAVAEFDAFVDNKATEEQKEFLGYILSYRGLEGYNAEVFADLFAIMAVRPDFVKEHFPLAEKIMRDRMDEVLDKNTSDRVVLPVISENRKAYVEKDQLKADKANKFIGRGSDRSSTEAYKNAWGDRANTGSYSKTDVVMLSAEGARTGRVAPDFAEIQKAMDAGATLLTDNEAGRNTKYNIGERDIAEYLLANGYTESAPGEWTPAKPNENQNEAPVSPDSTEDVSTPVETPEAALDLPDDTIMDDTTGLPVVFFHGTTAQFDTFNDGETFFTNQYHLAMEHVTGPRKKSGARIIGANLVMKNPLVLDAGDNLPDTYYLQNTISIKEQVAAGNHDGILISNDKNEAIGIVFKSNQITQIEYNKKTKKQVFRTPAPERNSLFTKVFSDASEPAPFSSLSDLLAQVAELGEDMDTFIDFLKANVPAIEKRLNARLSSIKFDDKKPESVIEMFRKDPEKVLLYRDFKNLAFVDGASGQYDSLIASVAIAYVLDDLSNAHPAAPSLLVDRMEEDGITYRSVTKEQFKDYMQSIPIRDIAERLARDLPTLLGLSVNDDARLGDARGTLEDLVKEVLVSIAETNDGGLVRIADVPTSKGLTQAIVLSETMKALQDKMGLRGRSGISKLMFPENIDGPTLDAPPEFVAQKQSRGSIETSTTEREVLKNMQSIAHVRTPVASLLKVLGQDIMFDLLGGKDESHLAENHPLRRSIEGKNLSILMDYDDAMHIADIMEANGPDTKVFYTFGISRVGRHQMQGPNPQNNKILRHSVTSTISMLDMRNNKTHLDYFWLTVAQSSGLYKVEKKNHAMIIEKTEGEFRARYRDAIYLAREFLITGEMDTAAFATAIRGLNQAPEGSVVPAGTVVKEYEVTMAVIDAVLAVAGLDEARATGTEDRFQTSLSFEIDGLTDGPGNMLVNMGQGLLTLNDYENLRRVGYFLGERNMTTNAYYTQQGNKDFYEMTTQFAEASMVLDETRTEQMRALARFAAHFGDFEIVTGPDGVKGYKMTRNTAKSPVTKKGYGAGVGGIARGIAEDMVLEFYRFMTEEAVNTPAEDLAYPEFFDDFKLLFKDAFDANIQWDRQFFDVGTIQHFTTIVEKTLGKILTEAAEKMLGNEILKVNDTLVFMTNVQAKYLQLAFEQRVRAILETRGADPKKPIRYQDLTVGEMKQIIADLKALAPLYYNGVQALGMGAFEGVISEATELSSTMDGRLRMKSTLPLPSDAGVKAIPYLNIGRGDAMMMNIVYGRENFPTRSIPIFDGVSLAIADIAAYSDLINEAVAENWNQDLLEPVLRDLMRFSQSVPANEQALLQAAFREVAKQQPKSIKFRTLESVAETLAGMVKANQARKAVFEKIPRSVNHMGGADRTINLGPEGFMDREEINALISKEMLNPTPKAEEEPADPKNHFTNLSVMTGMEMLRALLTTVKNKRLLEVLRTLQKTNPDVRVVTGNAAQIAAHRLNEGADPVLTTRKGSGFFDEKNNTIYLVSKNHETLVHELIHFTTFALVHKTYAGEGTPAQRDAVTRLEKLMEQFMGMDFSKASKTAQRAAKSAKAQILGHQAKNDAWSQAAALNEFMAWSLANEALGRELGNTLADGVLRFIKTVKALMARLLGSVAYDMFSNVLFNTRAILEPEDLNQEPSAVDPKTNEPPPSETPAEVVDGEVLVDEEVILDIFGEKGFLVPTGNGGSGNGNNGGSDGSSNDPGGTSRYNNFWINLIRTRLNEARQEGGSRKGNFQRDQLSRYLDNARRSYREMVMGGFVFSEEQRITYEAIHMVLALEVQLDARALNAMNKVFAHVVKTLRPEMFTGEVQDKYQAFMDALGRTTNDEQISDAIATFFAMSQTNDEFRFMLEQMPKPEGKNVSGFSEFVSTLTISILRKAVGAINPDDKNARDAMDILSRVILNQDSKEEFRILRLLMSSFDTADKYVSGKLRQISDLVSDYAYNVPDEQRLKALVATSVATVTNLFSDERVESSYEMIKTVTHNGTTFDDFVFIRELVAEMIGTDKNNEKIVALMDIVKRQVSALRESHRDNVPLTLQGNFSVKPTAEQWAAAHAVLARTDFSVLFDLRNADTTMSLISDQAYRTRQIKIYSDTVKRELTRTAALEVLEKSQQLADFMNGNGAGHQLLRNAFAINEVMGDPSKPGLVNAIDKLVSLLALDGKSDEERQMISDMYAQDPEAMKNIMVYMQKLNQNEDEKLQVSETILTDEYGEEYDYDPVYRMRMNGYKGYVPNLGNPDVTFTVEEDIYRPILEKRGFIRVGDYTADDMVSVTSKGYYVSSTRQNGGYAQGVMQSIQNTYRGVNAGTGITVNGTTSGIIMGYENLDLVNQELNRAGTVADPKEVLLPVFDKGEVIYYERGLNPDLLEKYTQPAGNLALQLGVWSGRQVEEKAAQSYNALLIDQLKKTWDKREPGTDKMFIDIRGEYYAWMRWERASDAQRKTMRRPDPIYADSWKVIPPQTKAYIAGVFGEDGFMVRKDQINTALGYAEPSIADFWSGKTRFSEGTQAVVRAVADMTLGRLKSGTSALTLLQTGAGALQETVTFAKDLIVTRSLIIPYLNSQANIFTLNLRGVPNKMIVNGYRDKLIEIEQYNQNSKKVMFLNTQYDLAEGDANKQAIIKDQIQVLKDQNRRMSIHSLVEAGAYKNISEGITDEDFDILKSGLSALVEKQVDRLPDIAKTLVRNGLVSQSTDIYRVANKAVQYGDFLAKAVYFDFLTQVQGMGEEAALSKINEEYVNFSTPPGRVRSALDKYGATWFITYKIRIAKTAMAQARQNPVRALLVNTLDPGNNTALHSNLITDVASGSIDWNLGWGMMINSPSLNPWLNVMGW